MLFAWIDGHPRADWDTLADFILAEQLAGVIPDIPGWQAETGTLSRLAYKIRTERKLRT